MNATPVMLLYDPLNVYLSQHVVLFHDHNIHVDISEGQK